MRALENDELGIGIAYGPGAGCDAVAADYDFIEYSPRVGMAVPHRSTDRARLVLNSSWLAVAGSCDPDPDLLRLLEEIVERRKPAYVAERLGFNRFSAGATTRATGLVLPPSYTLAGVAVAVRRISALRERLGVPVAFEIGTNYLQKRPGELSDGAFFAAIAELADCGIVLDLASVRADEANGRACAEMFFNALPLERIWEVQVSGTTQSGRFTLETQRGLVDAAIRRLAEQIVPRLPALRSLVYEVRPESLCGLAARSLRAQRAWLSNVWETRGTLHEPNAVTPRAPRALPSYEDARARVGTWERGIVARTAGLGSADDCDAEAFAMLGSTLAAARETAIAEGAELSLRLLTATLGRAALADLMRRYCAQTFAEALPATEALRFLQFVERERTEIPYLREVVALERAAAQAPYAGAETAIYFPCEPTEIFRALLRHDRPYTRDRRPHVVHVGPHGLRVEGQYTPTG